MTQSAKGTPHLGRYEQPLSSAPVKTPHSSLFVALPLLLTAYANAQEPTEPLFNDSHFHLTNYIQEGTDIHDFLRSWGTRPAA